MDGVKKGGKGQQTDSFDEDRSFARATLARIDALGNKGDLPVVALDLDLTLFDNTPRTRRILVDYFLERDMDADERHARIEEAWTRPLVFSILENLAALGVSRQEAQTRAFEFWWRHFFSDTYCSFDVPYSGAAEACRLLHSRGALLAYVTGRYADKMATGTVDSLRRYGFPICEPRTMLVMKTTPEESDDGYKRRVLQELPRMGEVVAAVDNEPAHCNVMREVLSGANVAIMMTRHSPTAPALEAGITRFRRWAAFDEV